MKRVRLCAAISACLLIWTAYPAVGQSQEDFAGAVSPLLMGTCAQCHNDRQAAGGLSVTGLDSSNSIVAHRAEWEKILRRLQAGEMPPAGAAKPSAAVVRAFTSVIESEFNRADTVARPDPGRVTARRLNRNEYSNTIRDLLGVEFHAEKYFPTDDSGDGFDNIGGLL